MKDMTIAGCRVRLVYHGTPGGRWTVRGTVQCGLDENGKRESIVTDAFDTREAAEQSAIARLGALLGQQVDRSHSRVRNWK